MMFVPNRVSLTFRCLILSLFTLAVVSVAHAQKVEVVGSATDIVSARPSVVNDSGDVFYVNGANFVVGTPATPNIRSFGSINNFLKPSGSDILPYVLQPGTNITYIGAGGLIQTNFTQKLVVAALGGAAPGLPANNNFSANQSQNFDYAVSPDKSITFRSSLVTNGTSALAIAVYAGTAGNLSLLLDPYHDVPGIAGYRPHNNGYFHVVRNTNGISILTGMARSTANNQDITAMWIHDSTNGVRLLYKAGFGSPSAMPGVAGSSMFELGFDVQSWGDINDAGQIAFRARGNDAAFNTIEGVYAGYPGNIQPVATNGLAVPGVAGATFNSFASFNPVRLGSNGKCVFSSIITGTGIGYSNNLVLVFGSSPSDLKILARSGSQAPGMPAGVNWNTNYSIVDFSARDEDFNNNYLVNDPIIIFGNNKVAILGKVVGAGVVSTPAGSANDSGIWVTDDSGNLTLVARRNSTLTTTTGSKAMSSYFKMQGGTGQDGKPSGGNRNGQFVFVNGVTTYRVGYTTLQLGKAAIVGGQFQVSFDTETGKTYKVQSTDVLPAPIWADVFTIPGDGTTKQYSTPSDGRKFFRLINP